MPRLKKWTSDFEIDKEVFPDWWHSTLESLAKTQPFGNGRVTLGLSFDMFKLPRDIVTDIWTKCRKLGLKILTTHYSAPAMPSKSLCFYMWKDLFGVLTNYRQHQNAL